MNSIYKIVFNKATQTFTAVSELAKGATKTQSQSAKQAGTFLPKFAKIALAISMVLGFSTSAMADLASDVAELKAEVAALKAQKTYVHVNGTGQVQAGNDTNLDTVDEVGGAKGIGAIAIGKNVIAVGKGATVIGGLGSNKATNDFSFSTGYMTEAKGTYSTSMGYNTEALADTSVAMGSETIALGRSSFAMGRTTQAKGDYSFAIGKGSVASGEGSVAAGIDSKALGIGSVVAGIDSKALGRGSLALGGNSFASKWGSIALGSLTKATGKYAVAIGYNTEASAEASTALGIGIVSSGFGSLATGGATKANGDFSTSMGYKSRADGSGSFAIGGIRKSDDEKYEGGTAYTAGSMALGTGTVAGVEGGKQEAFAMGYRAKATGNKSMALGFDSEAKGKGSIAIGSNAVAEFTNSINIGSDKNNKAKAMNSIVIGGTNNVADFYGNSDIDLVKWRSGAILGGQNNYLKGVNSVILGGDTNKALGFESAVLGGWENEARVKGSVALGGFRNIVDGRFGISGGYDNYVSGENAIALGEGLLSTNDNTVATGFHSSALGYTSIAMGYKSIAFSDRSLALGAENIAGVGSIDDNGTPDDKTDDIYTKGTEEAVAMGYRAKAVADKTLALGFDAVANNANSVALGSNAETRDFAQVDETDVINGLKYKEFSGFADGVVSVGKTAHEKQIINVAPGEISQTSTDAINGSQLYATTIVLGNVATSVKDNLGGNAAIDENGTITFTDIGGTGKDTVQEAIAFNKGNIETNIANINGNRTAIATKADKNADNLSVDDVDAWTVKLNNEADLAAPKGKLVTDTQVKDALDTKLETGDIKSSDKTVGITTAAGNVDLRVNLDNTSLTKNGNGVISIADGGVTTTKIADGNVTKAKLADEVTTILDKVGTGAVETANHNTVTGDVVKTYVDGKVATINTEVTNLGDTVNTLGDTITHVGKTSKETVKADNGSGINVKTTPATNEKGAIFTLSLDEDEVKALAGTTNLDTTYLKTDGSNVANKATFGDQVGTDTLGNSTKLAQIKAVKAVDDKVNTNTQDITDLEESVTTKLDKKANRNATNLNANDVAAWKAKIDTNSIETVTAGDGIDVSGGTAATNKEWVVALSQKTKTQLEKIDDNTAALAGKANISLDNISSDGTTVIKNAARDAVEVAVNPATNGVLKLVKTASAANHKDTYTLSIDETKLNDKVGKTFAK
ncbi:ESPR-type extended signal peptide-containing protein, partial [Pasteurella skyensis]